MITRRRLLANGAVVATVAGMPVWAGVIGVKAGVAAASTAAGGKVEHGLLLGVDYYPDQTPEKLWEEDARMIADSGFTNVRVAEFAWSLMEPSEGKFEFAWLHQSVEILHQHGIDVILGNAFGGASAMVVGKVSRSAAGQRRWYDRVSREGGGSPARANKTYRKLSLAIATEMAQAVSRIRRA